MLVMDVALLYPEALTRLDRLMPAAVKVGVEDMKRQYLTSAKAETPIGYRYVPIKRGKKGGVRRGTGTYKRSGELHKGWKVEKEDLGFIVFNDTPYGAVLEAGLYPGVGKKPKGFPGNYPRTVSTGGGIFSTQAKKGMLAPLVADDSIIKDAMDLIVEELEKQLG